MKNGDKIKVYFRETNSRSYLSGTYISHNRDELIMKRESYNQVVVMSSVKYFENDIDIKDAV